MARLLTDPATLVHIDGTPLLWLARLFISEVPWSVRNAHIDLLPKMLSVCAERGWPVCIVASDVAGALENRRTLEALHPKLILNTYEGYFEEDKPGEAREKEILESIRGSGAKLLLVGRGMPKQEEWIVAVKDQLNVPMIMPIGGFTDYVTGRSKTPPRFLGPSGLEWAYRLVHDPRRLAFRYLLEPLLLLGLILRASLHRAAWGRCAEQGPDPPQ
jgi:N-acetylglucosaminyldiphosphoundecaprenol N-acetyl-beta-D-mannosaminyltransferase